MYANLDGSRGRGPKGRTDVYVCVHIYIYIHTHIYTYTGRGPKGRTDETSEVSAKDSRAGYTVLSFQQPTFQKFTKNK